VPVVGQAALWGTERREEGDGGLKVKKGVVGDEAPLGIASAQPRRRPGYRAGACGGSPHTAVQHRNEKNPQNPVCWKSEFSLRI